MGSPASMGAGVGGGIGPGSRSAPPRLSTPLQPPSLGADLYQTHLYTQLWRWTIAGHLSHSSITASAGWSIISQSSCLASWDQSLSLFNSDHHDCLTAAPSVGSQLRHWIAELRRHTSVSKRVSNDLSCRFTTIRHFQQLLVSLLTLYYRLSRLLSITWLQFVQ